MKKMIKKPTGKLILLFLFTFLCFGVSAQWGETQYAKGYAHDVSFWTTNTNYNDRPNYNYNAGYEAFVYNQQEFRDYYNGVDNYVTTLYNAGVRDIPLPVLYLAPPYKPIMYTSTRPSISDMFDIRTSGGGYGGTPTRGTAVSTYSAPPSTTYYIDNDGDGYHGATISSTDRGFGGRSSNLRSSTNGADCNDSNSSVHKLNKCGKCEVEPVNESCGDLPCNTFTNRIKDILAHEGGYVNNPNDPGKETNKGITIAVWEENAKSLLKIEPTSANLKALTNDQAAVIYEKLYWDKINSDDIADGDIRYILFDFYVNAGGNAVKVMQKTLNQLGNNLPIDGVAGNNTINAINNTDSVQLYNNFKANRQQYYNNLANRSTKLATFLNGWTNRVNNFKNKTTTNNKNVNCN